MYVGLFIYFLISLPPQPFQWVSEHQSTQVIGTYVNHNSSKIEKYPHFDYQ